MMKTIYLILMCQYVFVDGGNRWMNFFKRKTFCDNPKDKLFVTAAENFILPLDDMKLEIKRNGISYTNIHFKQANRMLANRHLPVWTIQGVIDKNYADKIDGLELQRNDKVMDQLGDFTFYQEAETSSAAVYFHKRRELDGMIGYEFVIRRLPIDIFENVKKKTKNKPINQFGIKRRPFYSKYISRDKNLVEDPNSGVNDQEQMKTYGNKLYDGYPEILVIVAWDLANYWINGVCTFDWYTTIVSHVLTLFNGVDMLYSKLTKTNIQINIAGIIIGVERESFHFLKECFRAPMDIMGFYNVLNGECVITHVSRYLKSRKKKIPMDSYDIAIFLTKQQLLLVELDDDVADDESIAEKIACGLSGCVDKLYQCRKDDMGIISTGIISTATYLDSYPTITHEIAHLMTVRHDKTSFVTDTKDCHRNIMKSDGLWCDRCMSWSEDSEEAFRLFFSSPNCCSFINKPRSLNPPGQQVLLTADEQCQCYGYKSAVSTKKISCFCFNYLYAYCISTLRYLYAYFLCCSQMRFRELLNNFCRSHLYCTTEDDDFVEEPIPMDGTPCGVEKVCWQQKCSKINNHKHTGTSACGINTNDVL